MPEENCGSLEIERNLLNLSRSIHSNCITPLALIDNNLDSNFLTIYLGDVKYKNSKIERIRED